MITKEQIEQAGMSRLDFSRRLDMPYGTLTSKLLGYVPWEQKEEKKALEILEEESKKING